MEKYITISAKERLNRKIDELLEKQKGIGVEKGKAAGEFSSDWHDNAPYEQLERDFQMVNRRIADLRDLLRGAQVIQVVDQNERVTIGNTVHFYLNGQKKTVTIGSLGESESKYDLISYQSPLGQLLIGLQIGDVRTGTIVDKKVEVEVFDIEPPSNKYFDLQRNLKEW